MSTRTGKREREARNRHRRSLHADGIVTSFGWTSAAYFDRNGPKRKWVKLGRKKSVQRFVKFMSAVPVADSRNSS